MPYTVPVSFDKFLENINISGDQHQICSSRRDHIVSLLENHFTILEAFATGSIPKRTAVKGYADLDVMVVLHYGKHIEGKKPSQVLQSVRDALGEHRPQVRKNGQAVTLKYSTWPNVDIVPVSRSKNEDGTVNHYNVPDMNQEVWLHSRPKRHTSNMANRASSFGPEFRRIVKMIKWWNHQHSAYLQSYHIEVLALEILEGDFDEYPWNIFQFFDRAYSLVESSLWYEGAYVDEYLTPLGRQEALKRFDTARYKAREAWSATYNGRNQHERAIQLWRQIFGDRFPAYGS